MSYTAEQMREKIRRFGPGFDAGRHYLRRHIMSDGDWERRHDPEGYRDKQLISLLTEIRDLLRDFPHYEIPRERERFFQPSRPPALTQAAKGGIEL